MKIAFMGDVMLGRLVNEVLKHEPPEYPWGNTLSVLRSADVRICNLECVITDAGQPWGMTPKAFHFRTDEKNVASLNAPPINIVSIANNHVLNYEYEGLYRMLKVLKEAKIVFAGAGESFLDASTIGIYEFNGIKIGMVAVTDNELDWEAAEGKPGVFYVPIDLEDKRAKNLFELVKKTRDDVDVLIVSAHWGPNWGYRPQPDHIPFAKQLIDYGADIIFGHSCHVFQGIEIYKGKPILYSTGDFIDDYAVDEVEKNDQSFIFVVETEDKKIVRLKLYPTVIRNMQARLAQGEEEIEIIAKMKDLCIEFDTKSRWMEKEGFLEINI